MHIKTVLIILSSFLIVSFAGCKGQANPIDADTSHSQSSAGLTENAAHEPVSSVSESSQQDAPKLQTSSSEISSIETQSSTSQPAVLATQPAAQTNSSQQPVSSAVEKTQPSEFQPSDHSSASKPIAKQASAISPAEYQKRLGKGMDVDWSKTDQGRQFYHSKAAKDFAEAGVRHVRIRVKDAVDQSLFEDLDRQITDCLQNGIIPVIAYQADEFKNEPTQKNIDKVVNWWSAVAKHYQNASPLLSFDLIIEATDALNKQPQKLNEIYEQLVTEIRKTNPTRIIMISPRLRSDAQYLSELEIPSKHNHYLMAEWHFYASGPSKENERKLWTSGTKAEKQLIQDKINLALQWQKQTGIPTWVGAWMPGNYNDGNDYSIEEQVKFAQYMTKALSDAGIPFAVNSDTKFYDREKNVWIEDMKPVFNSIYH